MDISPATHILNFHGIGTPGRPLEPGEAPYWIDADLFLRMADRLAGLKEHTAITFDDGNDSDRAIALPALRDRGLTAGFFVLAGRIGEPGSLSAADIGDLESAGMTIGSHGWSHVDWRTLDPSGLEKEMVEARAAIQQHCRGPVDMAAVPFGAYNAAVLRHLRNAGYRAVFTSDGGAAGQAPVHARTSVRQGMSVADVERIIDGAEGALRRLRRAAAIARKRWI